MKKLKMMGRSLSNDEQKTIYGGIVPLAPYIPGLTGWNMDANGNCWCDFLNYITSTNQWSPICGQSCPVTMCTAGSIDPCPTCGR